METIVNIVFPVFGIVLTGYLAGRFGILGTAAAAALNRFIFFIALPPLLFTFTARAPVADVLNWPFIGTFLGGTVLTLVIALAVGRAFFGHTPAAAIVHGLAAVFANTVYMGIPLFLMAFGPDGTIPAIVSALCNLIVIGTVIAAIEVVSSDSATFGKIARDTLMSFVRNPLLMAAFGGIAFSYVGFSIPTPVENYLDLLGRAAGPTALFAIGLSLYGQPLRADMHEVGWLVTAKLLVHPALVWLLAVYVFALDTGTMKAAVFLAALPSGALVYVVAQRFDILVARTSAAIILSTAISVVTVSPLLIWLLN